MINVHSYGSKSTLDEMNSFSLNEAIDVRWITKDNERTSNTLQEGRE